MVQNDWSPHFFYTKKATQMVPLARLGMIPRYPNVPNEAASTMRQMLAALKCCHDHYMGHFDVKPEILSIRRHSWVRIIPSW